MAKKNRGSPSKHGHPDQHIHPLPPDQLGMYSPTRDYYSEKDISNYLNGQAPDEIVQNVERVKTEFVMGQPYEIWDVSTDITRWWVITNPTNLYSQKHFPSLDYTLSFHVGLMMRVASRSSEKNSDEVSQFEEVFRRMEQADKQLERAIEAVDFQSVGMQLRECLISLVSGVRRRIDYQVSEVGTHPKDADVVSWSKLLTNKLCGGSKNDEIRNYINATIDKTWPLVNWLTHHRNANKTSAIIAVEAVGTLVKAFLTLVSREREDRTDQCPICKSRNVRTHFDIEVGTDGAYFESCAQCEWSSHPSHRGNS